MLQPRSPRNRKSTANRTDRTTVPRWCRAPTEFPTNLYNYFSDKRSNGLESSYFQGPVVPFILSDNFSFPISVSRFLITFCHRVTVPTTWIMIISCNGGWKRWQKKNCLSSVVENISFSYHFLTRFFSRCFPFFYSSFFFGGLTPQGKSFYVFPSRSVRIFFIIILSGNILIFKVILKEMRITFKNVYFLIVLTNIHRVLLPGLCYKPDRSGPGEK